MMVVYTYSDNTRSGKTRNEALLVELIEKLWNSNLAPQVVRVARNTFMYSLSKVCNILGSLFQDCSSGPLLFASLCAPCCQNGFLSWKILVLERNKERKLQC